MTRNTNNANRSNRSNRQPSPSPQTSSESEAPTAGTTEAANVVSMRPAKGQRGNIFETINQEVSEAQANKQSQLSEARQRLAEASDLWGQGAERERDAKEMAARAAILLFQARTAGTLNGEELSALLGDQFGFKAKQDGSPSKTPDGQGEAIRKRIVRAVMAHEHATGTNPNHRFFEKVPAQELEPVINGMVNGQIGFWNAYERFAEIKKAHDADPAPAHLDPKRIAALADALGKDGVALAIVNNSALAGAYAALLKMLQIVGEEAQSLRVEAA